MAVGSMGFNHSGQDAPIDGTSVASTTIYSPGGGLSVSPIFLTFETVNVDAVTLTAIVSVGTNNPDYDNILFAHGIKPVEGAMETVQLPSAQSFSGGVDVKVKVVRAASGTDLTFCAGIGYLAHGFN